MTTAIRLLLLAALMALATPAQNLPADVQQAVKDYRLDLAKANRFTDAMAELTAYTLKQPDWQKKVMERMKLPFDQQMKAMAAEPGTAAILKKHGLEAREYSIGLFALRAAIYSAKGTNIGIANLASPANVSFAKANPALVEKFMKADAAGR